VIKLFFARKPYGEVFYFYISKPAKILLRLLKLEKTIKPFVFNMDEIRNKSGETRLVKIIGEDLNDVCKDLELNVLNKSPFIQNFGAKFDKRKVVTYFKKRLDNDIKNIVIFINIIDWYQDKSEGRIQSPVVFSIERTLCFETLKDFALSEYNIALSSCISFRNVFEFLFHIFGNLYLSAIAAIAPFAHFMKYPHDHKNRTESRERPVLASYYSLNGVTFDLTRRCDFFWLLKSRIPHEQVLIYFERKDAPATDEMGCLFRENGVRALAMSKGGTNTKKVPVYNPSMVQTKTITLLTTRVILLIIKELLHCRLESFVYLAGALYFGREYAKAYDFYHCAGIKINVDSTDFGYQHIPRGLALEKLGGVSVSYQRSTMPIPQFFLGSMSDIFFPFGPYYFPIIQRSEFNNASIVNCGYITDYSFGSVEKRSTNLREKMRANGAEFIVCYFDENSSDDRFSLVPHKKSAYVYKTLMNWLLSDDTIGLICSPKRPGTLSARLSTISGLMERAKATGRCVFMGGEYTASNYPAEAAQASDMVISLLVGGTTSLESALAGCRVLYLDLEGLHSFPEYEFGRGTIVFDNLDNLLGALDRYRRNPGSFVDLGNIDMMPMIKQKDPFRDGKAAERIGQYLHWLLLAFERGETKDEAIGYANRNFGDMWGSEHVLICR